LKLSLRVKQKSTMIKLKRGTKRWGTGNKTGEPQNVKRTYLGGLTSDLTTGKSGKLHENTSIERVSRKKNRSEKKPQKSEKVGLQYDGGRFHQKKKKGDTR